MFSLRGSPAATASLLLNFEGVATTMIAALVFKEAIGRRAGLAILCTSVASILLSLNLNGDWGMSIGALGIVAACVLWGIDNNFTRNISAKDPLTIVTIKGLGAGSFSLLLALILRSPLPALAVALRAMILGGASYGLSVVLFVRAMRGLGAARTSALFSAAPLAGVLLSLLLFREIPSALFVMALPLMIAGTLLVLNDQHGHVHVHTPVAHAHRHQHTDEHHAHEIPEDVAADQAHSHEHEHPQIEHEHGHMPDTHHRHLHD
jgi:drug/metabolite transporter (DMT)-like permease